MKSEIIKSAAPLKRNRGLAFALSFLFTGLGQIYNGDFWKGIVFLLFRILSLLIIPFLIITQSRAFPFLFLTAAVLIYCLLGLISPLEAMCSAGGKNAFNLKKYNSLFFYLLYGIISPVLIIVPLILIMTFFSIEKIRSDEMMPTLLKNEYILINKYAANKIDAGDIILYSSHNSNNVGRIIAGEGNTIVRKKNIYYINDSALKYNIIPKSELEKTGIDNSEDLFYEINGERKYPVKIKSGNNKPDLIKPVFLGESQFFIAFDNRTSGGGYKVIFSNAVLGKAEGIIYSKRIIRILNSLN